MRVASVRREASSDGAIQRLVLEAPPANIVGIETCRALTRELAAIVDEPRTRLVVLTGAGEHFSYGASVEEHLPETAERMLAVLHQVVKDLASMPVPTVAAVRGRCFGGGLELALACGIVVVEEGATLAAPEVRLGVFAPAATALLAGSVPRALAEDVLLTGRELDAEEAVRFGLASRLAPRGGLDATIDELAAGTFLPRSAASLRVATRALRAATETGLFSRLDAAERTYVRDLLPLDDATEGIRAFLEKRAPHWENPR